MKTTNKYKQNQLQITPQHIDITKIAFIKSYHPIVLRHAISNNKKINLDICLAFLEDKSVIRYLLLAGISDVLNLKNKYTRNISLATPASALFEISKFKKALEKSKSILLSEGEELANGTNCKNVTCIESLLKYGRNNLVDVLPSINDITIASAVENQENQELLFECLPNSRVNAIKQICKSPFSQLEGNSVAIIKIAYELKQFLLKPTLFGTDPFTFELRDYSKRVLDYIGQFPKNIRFTAFKNIRVEVLIDALKVLEPYEQYKLLKNCDISKSNYVFEKYTKRPNYREANFKVLNKIVRTIELLAREQHKISLNRDNNNTEGLKSAGTFYQINTFDKQVWRQLINEVSLKQIYCATCKARKHSSMSDFMSFLKKESIQIAYSELDKKMEVYSHEILDFQDQIIDECKRIESTYRDIELTALEAEIMMFHSKTNKLKTVSVETTVERTKNLEQSVEVYNHDELMEEIILGLKENDEKTFQKIQSKGNKKKLVYVPSDFNQKLDELAKEFPNFLSVINFLRGVLAESFLTQQPLDLPVINLDGPAGIGKSLFVKCFTSSFNLSFNSIPVTSMGDKFELMGANRTWNNASLGACAKALLLKGDTFSPCFLIDELCLVRSAGERNIVPTLLGLFESEQSKSLTENFLGISVDFSGLVIFTTTNDIANLLPALRSRIVSFSIKEPSREQMKTIAENIYSKYRNERSLENFIAESIPASCVTFYLNLPPRQAKQALIAAIRNAIQRFDVNSRIPVSLAPKDFEIQENFSSPSPLGFIH